MNEGIEFECVDTRRPEEDWPPVFEHFTSDSYRLYDDGAGHVDVKCTEECPHCGEVGHWTTVAESDL